MSSWVPALGSDPLSDHRPEEGVECPKGSTILEGTIFEVDTGSCTYAFFEQPLLADLVPGDLVEMVLWHNDLVNPEPAEGHAALMVDGVLFWELSVEIPGDAYAYTEQVEVDFASAPGAMIQLHLHNHGSNAWSWLRIERQPR